VIAWKSRLPEAGADASPLLPVLTLKPCKAVLILSPGLGGGGWVQRWWRKQSADGVGAAFLWGDTPFRFLL